MKSLILQTSSRYLKWCLLAFSVYLLIRGHNAPGGGFVGGLMAGSAFVLEAIAYSASVARKSIILPAPTFMAIGLLLAVGSGISSLFRNMPFMSGQWGEIAIGNFHLYMGTPVFFDLGVYFVVFGVSLTIILELMEE